MSEAEEDLIAKISETLEIHGYLPRFRAGLKVIALKTAQELAQSHEIPQTEAVGPKVFKEDADFVQIELCKDLFRALNLDYSLDMIEAEATGKQIDLKTAFPGIPKNPKVPVLVPLLQRLQTSWPFFRKDRSQKTLDSLLKSNALRVLRVTLFI
jgi:hypothetical protein